jgi:hypothetical protein
MTNIDQYRDNLISKVEFIEKQFADLEKSSIVETYESEKIEKSVEFNDFDSAKIYFEQQNLHTRMNGFIETLNKSLDTELEVGKFLKGFKRLCLYQAIVGQEELDNIYKSAQTISDIKKFNIKKEAEETKLDKVIYIDAVAHNLHVQKDANGKSQYKILDDLADISKSIGEKEREDRLLLLSNPIGNVSRLRDISGVTILHKSNPSLSKSVSFWKIFEKYVKFGKEKLTDEELVLLREWLYSAI